MTVIPVGPRQLARLDAVARRIAELPGPLPERWHGALATWPVPFVRATWAARPDAPATLLARAGRDRHPKVRSAVVGNPATPPAEAVRLAGSCAPYGPLIAATRPDCPDLLAADLLGRVGTLGARRCTSWRRLLAGRARLLAGKPATQQVAVDTAVRVYGLVPTAVFAAAGPELQTHRLAEALADTDSLAEALGVAAPLHGTAEQRGLVRDWLAGHAADGDPKDRTALLWWADPTPVGGGVSARTLRPLLGQVAQHTTNRRLRDLAATAARFTPSLVADLGANPLAGDDELDAAIRTLPTSAVSELIERYDLPGRRWRELGYQVLVARGVWSDRAHPPVLELPPCQAHLFPAELVDVLEPLLATPAWPVLDASFADNDYGCRTPLAHLMATAAAVADVPVPDQVREAAARLPLQAPLVPVASGPEPGSDEPPF